jgi:uncharacterized surface protein with fasciclin (FAS1) repeats
MNHLRSRVGAAAAIAAAFSGPAWAQEAPAAPAPAQPSTGAYRPIAPAGDVLATLEASGQFSTFVKAINATSLAQIFRTQPNITVLAPTYVAFAALPPGQLDALMKDIPQLQRLVTYHLINAKLTSAEIKGHAATSIPTVAGSAVTIDGSGVSIRVNDATVIQPDVAASNGVVQVIDKVLSPGAAQTPAPSGGGAGSP